jgi:hypothetical protein
MLPVAMADPKGFLILSVGHGGHAEANWSNEGFFALGPQATFLRRVAGQWGVPVIAYTRRVVGDSGNGRPRIYLEGDSPGMGTNTEWGEYFFPICQDMVVFK